MEKLFRIVAPLVLLFLTVASANASPAAAQVPDGWHASPPVRYEPLGPFRLQAQTAYASAPFFPAQIVGAYGLNALDLPNPTGAGVTVAIVDAYGDTDAGLVDHIQSDLQQFCIDTRLPYNPPSSAQPTLTEAFPEGAPTVSDSGWALETALDVEWVHAIAPGANILLVVSPDNQDSVFNCVPYAAAHASTVSMSWGGDEFSGENSLDATCFSPTAFPNTAFFAATGDGGAGVEYPSTSPNVTAIGGTSITIDTNNNWVSETGWSGSGGGMSAFEPYDSFQSSWVLSGNREVPDVSAVADPNTGVYVIQGGSGWLVGGTSLSTPIWSGIIGVLDGNLAQPIGESTLLSALYATGDPANIEANFHDILTGTNGEFSCGVGYDLVTGIGSPMCAALLGNIIDREGGLPPGAPTTISVPAVSGAYKQTITLSAVLKNRTTSAPISGAALAFSVSGAALGAAVTNTSGVAKISYFIAKSAPIGADPIGVQYAGNSALLAATGSGTLTVQQAVTSTTASNVSGTAGQTVLLTATVLASGIALTGMPVAFQVDGVAAGSAGTNNSGVASVSYTIPASFAGGSHTITASFANTLQYGPSSGTAALTVTVVQSATAISTPSASGAYKQTIPVVSTLTNAVTGTPIAGATLSFTIDGAVSTAVTNSHGIATVSYFIAKATPIGANAVSVTYAGSTTFLASTALGTLTVNQAVTTIAVPTVSGANSQAVSLTATVDASGVALSGVQVSFAVDGVPVGTATVNNNGAAAFTYTIPATATVGAHVVSVTYAGSTQYGAAAGTGVLNVT